MLNHDLWRLIGGHVCWPHCYDASPDGQADHPASLCIDCVEKRLGRRLVPEDFMPAPLTFGRNRSPRLIERVGE